VPLIFHTAWGGNVSNGSGPGADWEKVETSEVQRTLDAQMGRDAGMTVPTMTVMAPEPAVVKGGEGMARSGPRVKGLG
jgi:hypothetical protein